MANQPDFDIDPDELPLYHQWAACQKLWAECFRQYLKDCKDVWTKPEKDHDPEALAALNDLLTDMRQLRHICCHLNELEPEYVREKFIRWIRNQSH